MGNINSVNEAQQLVHVKIIEDKTLWAKIIDLAKDFSALAAIITVVVTIGAKLALPAPTFAQIWVSIAGVDENNNPPESEIIANEEITSDEKNENITDLRDYFGWTYFGNKEEENAYYERVDGKTELVANTVWKPIMKVFVRTAPISDLNNDPDKIGVVDPGKKECFLVKEISINDRTQSVWFKGQEGKCT